MYFYPLTTFFGLTVANGLKCVDQVPKGLVHIPSSLLYQALCVVPTRFKARGVFLLCAWISTLCIRILVHVCIPNVATSLCCTELVVCFLFVCFMNRSA